MELKPLEKDEIQNIARSAIEDCVDFVESEIAFSRLKSQRYYEGNVGHWPRRGSVQRCIYKSA